MKLMLFKHLNPLLLIACGFVFATSSCSKVEDLYAPTPSDESSKLLPNGVISDSFNWSTAKAVDIHIAVDDDFEGKYSYKLEVYDSEPDTEGSMLLAAGLAKKGKDLVTKATIPSVLENVFVKQTSPTGLVSYFMVGVNGNTVSTVGAIEKAASVGFKDLNLLASTSSRPTNVVSVVAPAAIPETSIVYDGNVNASNIVPNGVYVILENATVTNASGLTAGNKLYVKGTWDLSAGNVVIPAGVEIVIMPGGQLKNAAGNKITLSAGAKLTNFGGVTTQSVNTYGLKIDGTLEIVGGTFTNNEKAKINSLDVKSNGIVINNDRMTIGTASFVDSRLDVFCNMTVTTKLFVDGSVIYVARGVNLTVLNANAKGATFELDEAAVFRADGHVEFEHSSKRVNSVVGKGSSKKKALASMKKVTAKSKNGKRGVDYRGNLNVACDEHDTNGRYNTNYYCGPQVKKHDRCDDFKIIVEEGCNGGGSVPNVPNPPVEPPPLTIVELSPYTYSFEDNWPTTKRDYDMNDFVVVVQIVKYQNAENKVEKVVIKNKVISVGASKNLAAAIQLEKVAVSDIKDVDYTDGSVVGAVLPLGSSGLEQGQSKPVLTIVDDAHAAFDVLAPTFVSTKNNAYQPFETEVVVEFNNPISNFCYDDINPFIAYYDNVKQGNRYEVHMVGSAGTDKIKSRSNLEHQGLASELHATDMFKTLFNEPFAVRTPGEFVYPNETQNIKVAYPNFINWVISGGTTHQDWFLN